MTQSFHVRAARTPDVPRIVELVEPLVARRILLGKERVDLYGAVQEFRVAESDDGDVVGCGALHVMWEDLGEVRTLAVHDDWLGHGVGHALLQALEEDARGLDDLACAGAAVDDDRHSGDLGARGAQRLDRLERGTAGGRGVLEDDDALARDIRPLDLPAPAVVLRLLAHDERVVREAACGALVEDGRGDRVGAHGHAAHRGDIRNLGDEVEHHLADERGHAMVEAHLAEVDVVRRLLAAGEREVAVEHGVVRDVLDELAARVGGEGGPGCHPNTLRRAS